MDTNSVITKAEASPEVVAARAAVHLLMQQESVLSREVQRLAADRKLLQTELASMLITKQDAFSALTDARRQHKDLVSRNEAIYRQVNEIRENAAALIDQRDQLKTYVDTLHNEISLLEKARVGATRALDAVAREAVKHGATGGSQIVSGSPADITVGKEQDAREAAAFNDFFNTDLEHDKSRDWILSDAL